MRSRANRKLVKIEEVIEPHPIRSTSFAKAYPELAQMWDYKRNCGFGPEDFSYGSQVEAWFKCPKGKDHRFQKALCSIGRAMRSGAAPMGCGFCYGQRPSVTNNLKYRFPSIAKEWMTKKNGFAPDQISYGSSKIVWWRCPKGHQYQASIASRTGNGSGCRICNVGTATDLRKYPEVLKEFDYKKNKGVDPFALPVGLKVFWVCAKYKDHKWKSGFYRTKNTRCPYCSNKKGSKENNLKLKFPEIAKQWHPTKNGDLKPTDVSATSAIRIWWKCKKGPDHEWQVSIRDRTYDNTGCPFCKFRKTSVTNVISTVAPALVKEWHPKKNGKLKPSEVRCHSRSRYWWKCPTCSTDYKADAYSRIVTGTGCKQCACLVNIERILKVRGLSIKTRTASPSKSKHQKEG